VLVGNDDGFVWKLAFSDAPLLAGQRDRNGKRRVFVQVAGALIFARLKASPAGFEGQFVEAHALDSKTANLTVSQISMSVPSCGCKRDVNAVGSIGAPVSTVGDRLD
jgi:hypothetical protein